VEENRRGGGKDRRASGRDKMRTNRKCHRYFRLVPKSTTLDDLEGPLNKLCFKTNVPCSCYFTSHIQSAFRQYMTAADVQPRVRCYNGLTIEELVDVGKEITCYIARFPCDITVLAVTGLCCGIILAYSPLYFTYTIYNIIEDM